MQIFSKILLSLSAGALLFASCTKQTEEPKTDDYFPLEIGKYILYDVDSITYDDHSRTTYHNNYQMRYEVVDTFRDNEGRLSYAIDVLQRVTSNDTFVGRDVIHVTHTGARLEWTQTNAKIIKMVFPIGASTPSWDGLTFVEPREPAMAEYNTSVFPWEFKYSKIGESFDPGNNYFEETVTVTGIDEKTNEPGDSVYADRNFYQEIYAKGYGMVFKERIYWVYNIEQDYKKGYQLIMRAVTQN
ncbi:MAG TPA: hypothetical protein VLZ83_01440 [Edaphocola sp.]|nr:hypothetical protein [Edaphocola sp.]